MDLSKLPKLSDTKAQDSAQGHAPGGAPPEVPTPVMPQPTRSDFGQQAPSIGLAEAWISVGVGAFVLLIMPRFLQWVSSKLFHTHFSPFLKNLDDPTSIVPYTQVPEFWSDLGPTLLGVVLIVDGLLIFTRRPILLLLAIGLTGISTLYNLWYVASSYGTYGLAPYSLLAVIFGGFIMATQWSTYQRMRQARR